MSLAGCQINWIYVNLHLQKSLEIFDKNSADKIWSKKNKGGKVPFLMPIRVKKLYRDTRAISEYHPYKKKCSAIFLFVKKRTSEGFEWK